MKLFPYLLVLILVCHFPADGNNKKKRTPALLPTILRFTMPVGLTIFKEFKDLWSGLRTSNSTDKQQEKVGELVQILSKLTNLENEVKSTAENAVMTLLRTFPKIVKLELILHELTLIQNQLNFAEEQMRLYMDEGYEGKSEDDSDPFIDFRNEMPPNMTVDYTLLEQMSSSMSNREGISKRIMEVYTVTDFANWVTGHSFNSLMSLLRRMNDLVVGGERNGLFDEITEIATEMTANVCTLRHSPYQTIYNLYVSIAAAELKGNCVLQFAYTLLKMYQKGDFTTESRLAIRAYGRYAKEKIDSLLKVLPISERSVYNCDAPKQVDGETYTYLLRFHQAYIENEVNLNAGRNCWKDCGDYSPKTQYYGCFENKFCANQPKCEGPVLYCRAAPHEIKICRSTRKDRRYDWIKYEGGSHYGKHTTCQDRNYFKVNSWWKHQIWRCSYCLCLCDDKSLESERYFNLRNVTSDRENNKVVTGVRIVKKNQIIHLQIQEGVLNPLGVINTTTLSWKPVDNYTISDKTVKNYTDYFTMDNDWRALDTNEMTGLPGYVVTGVKFRKRDTHVDVDVHMTPFNFTTGKLQLVPSNHSYWIASNETHPQTGDKRTQIPLEAPDVPLRLGPHLLNSRKDQYILFQATDMKKDAAQSTVPYFDSQPLTSDGYALSGFGLIHRGKPGSGGFIAPLVISYDFAAHLNFTENSKF